MFYLIEIRQRHRLEHAFKTMFKNRVQTRVENHDRNRVENHARNRVQSRIQKRVRIHVRKLKNIVNKNISFLKITDPKKRDFIVN